MPLFTFRRPSPTNLPRSLRKLSPAVEGVEPRLLMSGATIGGTVMKDLTGNGLSSDDLALSGVTVDLYKSGSSTVFESTKSAGNGAFSFNNVPAGSYFVQQITPSGYYPTGAVTGHNYSVAKGQTVGGNFADFKLLPTPTITGLSYTVTAPNGVKKTVSTLPGNIQKGDTVVAKFTLAKAEQISLVVYSAPNNDFDLTNEKKQIIFVQATTLNAGKQTLTVQIPKGDFHIALIAGPAIDHLVSTSTNIDYSPQGRLLDSDEL